MIEIKVNVTDGASPMLRAVIAALTGKESAELNEQGGIAARNAAIQYHREFDKSGGWRGKRYLGKGPNEGGNFGSDVARGWSLESFNSGGAVIANDATYYSFKVRGGTIVPKRAKALTIPLIQEARGLRASVYEQNTGHQLFLSKSKNALMEKTDDGKVRSVYALVKSITMGPWPNALPPDELIASAFAGKYREALAELISSS